MKGGKENEGTKGERRIDGEGEDVGGNYYFRLCVDCRPVRTLRLAR